MKPSLYLFCLLVFFSAGTSLSAQCTSDAGSLGNTNPQDLCEGTSIVIAGAGNAVLDGNDVLVFVAYTGASPVTGTVLATSLTGVFPYQAALLANSPFSIAAVVGDNNGSGLVDWSDACLSVSPPATINYHANPEVQSNEVTLTCQSSTATLTAVADQPNVSFVWSNGNILPDNPVQAPGIYSVTVTNQWGCTGMTNVIVTEDIAVPLVSVDPPPTITCITISAPLSITVLTPNATVLWTGPNGFISAQPNPVVFQPGTYTALVTAPNGCLASYSVQVLADNIPPLADAGSNKGLNCGPGPVVLDGNASSQGAGFEFAWSGPSGFQSNSTLTPTASMAGTYVLTVTNALNGCTATDAVEVVNGIGVTLTPHPASFCGVYDGSISGEYSSPGVSFVWDPSFATGASPSFLLPGFTYTVTVTDAGGCTGMGSAAVTGGMPQITATAVSPTCAGDSDGVIVINTVGLFQPITYNWTSNTGSSGSENVSVINGLPGGTYSITATGSSGCTATTSIFLNSPLPVDVHLEQSGCGSTSVLAVASGGAGAYVFSWNDPGNSTSNLVTNLPPGTYTVTITDANGCFKLASITISADNALCSSVQGRVLRDEGSNCLDDGEPGLAGWIVRADGLGTTSFYALTDTAGYYDLSVAGGIDYTLSVVPPSSLWVPCLTDIPIGVVAPEDTLNAPDFMVGETVLCPDLEVSISSSILRRCFSNNYYTVQYSNNGTDAAEDAYLIVTLDPFITLEWAQFPYSILPNGSIRFELGDIAPGVQGFFVLRVAVSCDAVLGQTHCTEAHIYPDSSCLTPSAQWSGASLDLSSECDGDSVHFIIKNIGTGPMSGTLNYVVIEDAVMLMQASGNGLDVGDSIVVSFPANGSTWRVEVDQEPFHPGFSQPVLSVEGCTANAFFSTGFVSQFPSNDADPWLDIDCQANVGSYDPNDKQGFPLGYGPAHYVRPGTDIEYLIRFQNTGTDTAFNIVVIDSLSPWLDPGTVRPGVSSHPYQFDLSGAGVLKFSFQDILLPDSNINKAASHGFVRFRISPRADVPLETDIFNRADIYFDFNSPVLTNTTVHRIGENFVTVGLWQPVAPQVSVVVAPNPFFNQAILTVKGLPDPDDLGLRIFSSQGNLVREMQGEGPSFLLKREDLPQGVYFFTIEKEGVVIGRGKIVAE